MVAITGAGLVWWWLSLGAEHCRCHRTTLVLGLSSPGVVDVVVAVVRWMVVVAGLSLLLLGDARAGGVVVVIVVSMDRRWWWPGHRHHRWVMLRLGSLSLSLACNSGCCRLGWLVSLSLACNRWWWWLAPAWLGLLLSSLGWCSRQSRHWVTQRWAGGQQWVCWQ